MIILVTIVNTRKGEEETIIYGTSHFEVSEKLKDNFRKPEKIKIEILGIKELKNLELQLEKET